MGQCQSQEMQRSLKMDLMNRAVCLLGAAAIVCVSITTVVASDDLAVEALGGQGDAAGRVHVAIFQADATPPIGSPVAYAPARSITDPLSARGIVLLGSGLPIVLCSVDWIGIGNDGQDRWKKCLALAAGTSPDRVAVHTVHQHDGPRCDFSAERLLAIHQLDGIHFDDEFAQEVIEATAKAIRKAIREAKPVSHVGVGKAQVEKVASNRRILGEDGRVRLGRMSSTKNPEAIEAPEGLIDPMVRLLSLWNEDQPLVCLSYYATHPQSFYGQGDVTPDFVGLARNQREKETDGLPHIHFNGAGGNIAAGKYNDGSAENRPILMNRLADGMRRAWEQTERFPLSPSDIDWRVDPALLPLADHLDSTQLSETLSDLKANPRARLSAALKLAYWERHCLEQPILFSCLHMGPVSILHMPGELFVEYQLAAQQLRPDRFICLAAYGDYGPGYIGTAIAYEQGGYETQPSSSNVSPEVERMLMDAIRRLLNVSLN
jgi:hypothetical protein